MVFFIATIIACSCYVFLNFDFGPEIADCLAPALPFVLTLISYVLFVLFAMLCVYSVYSCWNAEDD